MHTLGDKGCLNFSSGDIYANLRQHVKFLPHASNLFESDKATLINYLVYVRHLVHLSDFGYMPVATA